MKLPSHVYSQLGPVPVVAVAGLLLKDDPVFGHWDPVKRQVEVDPSACDAARVATLYHEVVHLALGDAGAADAFNQDQQEVICNAVGTYLAAATLAGYLKLCEPRE